jgi:6-phosphogluconate dehydrogenase
MVVDGGNALFGDTIRRTEALQAKGLHFVGAGVSGGEEGALNGPSIMVGGSAEAYETLGPIVESIAAVVDGTPCAAHLGTDGAGHFVKMVHNGIEYADMQLIGEAYDLLRNVAGWSRRRSPTSSATGTAASSTPSSSRSPPTCSPRSTPRPGRRSSTWCSTRPA